MNNIHESMGFEDLQLPCHKNLKSEVVPEGWKGSTCSKEIEVGVECRKVAGLPHEKRTKGISQASQISNILASHYSCHISFQRCPPVLIWLKYLRHHIETEAYHIHPCLVPLFDKDCQSREPMRVGMDRRTDGCLLLFKRFLRLDSIRQDI